ncbi:MAG: NUDIX domain-containing protein [Candidatus Dojkabacteria bacterium]|nr:NUDIX domain-containing protein [Candidatus Dojkabacteria bacterium]
MNLRIGLKAVLVYRRKILLLKRVEAITRGGTWDLPGGLINQNEKLLEGLRREVFEETGVRIKKVNIPLDVGYFNEGIYKYKNVIRVIYLCSINTSSIKLSREHSEYKWFTMKELEKLNPQDFISPNTFKLLLTRIKETLKINLTKTSRKIDDH